MATTNNGTTGSETFGTTSPVTGSAPTATDDGQPVGDLSGIMVVLDSASTRTLSGAGTLDCYVFDASVGLWSRYPAGDFTCVGIPASQRSVAFQAGDLQVRRGRIKWVPTGVTFSAGSAGVTVWQIGFSPLARGVYP